MKALLLTVGLLAAASTAYADSVNGYYRNNGAYVAPYQRSSRNGTVTDNYSYKGNSNPYTGERGSSRYRSDTTSPYFNGSTNSRGGYGHSRY